MMGKSIRMFDVLERVKNIEERINYIEEEFIKLEDHLFEVLKKCDKEEDEKEK